MKVAPASPGPAPGNGSLLGSWPALLFALLVAAAAIYAFSPRPPPPFAATEVHPDGVLIDGLARADDRLLAVGEQGIVLYADGVKGPWHKAKVEPQRGSTLTKVKFIDDKVVLAVGHDGWIVRSVDRGETWKEVFFISGEDDGSAEPAATDGAIAAPADASMSAEPPAEPERSDAPAADTSSSPWGDFEALGSDMVMPLQPDPLLGIAGPYNGRIFVFGGFGMMLKSDDQGQSWTRVTDAALGDHHLNAMVRASDGALIVVGERGLMARSADQGESWQLMPSIYDGSFFGVVALKSNGLLAFGMRGHVFRSGDNGNSWQESKVPTESSLFGGNVSANGDVVLVGAGSTLLVSTDDGRSFTQPTETDFHDLATVLPVSATSWLVGGDGGIKLVTSAQHHEGAQP